MTGHNVLHPMGWDAFGLPAEQYAIETGTHPRLTTSTNVNRFREQLQSLGFSYDWDREVATCDPSYYKWTQWIFTKLLERGLAYQAEVPVNWCPALGTVLANEEVIDGLSERGNHPVIRKPMKQWMLKITAYGDRLLNDLDDLDWPESIKEMQRNWIGRSEGAQLAFDVPGVDHEALGKLEVYTTRPDTLFGATYLVVACGAPARGRARVGGAERPPRRVHARASRKSDLERTGPPRKRRGVFTGAHATHPLTGDRRRSVADYGLGTYGTGAIMAVPAHDERDFEFATAAGADRRGRPGADDDEASSDRKGAYSGAGAMVNSACEHLDVNGLPNAEAGEKIASWLADRGVGAKKVNFKLRDWLCGSGTGASRSRWCTPRARTISSPCRSRTCPSCSPRRRASSPAATARAHSRTSRTGSRRWTRATGRRPRGARPTRCRSGPGRAGITSGSSTLRTRTRWWTATWSRCRCSRTYTPGDDPQGTRALPRTLGSGTRCCQTSARETHDAVSAGS